MKLLVGIVLSSFDIKILFITSTNFRTLFHDNIKLMLRLGYIILFQEQLLTTR